MISLCLILDNAESIQIIFINLSYTLYQYLSLELGSLVIFIRYIIQNNWSLETFTHIFRSFPDLYNAEVIPDTRNGRSFTRIDFELIPIIIVGLEYLFMYSAYLQDTYFKRLFTYWYILVYGKVTFHQYTSIRKTLLALEAIGPAVCMIQRRTWIFFYFQVDNTTSRGGKFIWIHVWFLWIWWWQ